jgi:hypothetical protein
MELLFLPAGVTSPPGEHGDCIYKATGSPLVAACVSQAIKLHTQEKDTHLLKKEIRASRSPGQS